MRYVCKKITTLKVHDSIVENEDSILVLLNNLKDKEITFSLTIGNDPVYKFVKIITVQDKSFRWKLYKDQSSLERHSLISDIKCIEIIMNEDMLGIVNPDLSRFSTLDIVE